MPRFLVQPKPVKFDLALLTSNAIGVCSVQKYITRDDKIQSRKLAYFQISEPLLKLAHSLDDIPFDKNPQRQAVNCDP